MPERVELNEVEVKLAAYVGKSRYKANRYGNIQDRQIGDRDPYQNDIQGFGAELAVAKALGIYPDLDISPRRGGHDLVYRGTTIDVKQTPYTYGKLLAPLHTDLTNPPDIYVLVTGELPIFQIVGFAHARDLLRPDRIDDLGKGPGYMLDQRHLTDWSLLHGRF